MTESSTTGYLPDMYRVDPLHRIRHRAEKRSWISIAYAPAYVVYRWQAIFCPKLDETLQRAFGFSPLKKASVTPWRAGVEKPNREVAARPGRWKNWFTRKEKLTLYRAVRYESQQLLNPCPFYQKMYFPI